MDRYLPGLHDDTHGPGDFEPHWVVASLAFVVLGALVRWSRLSTPDS